MIAAKALAFLEKNYDKYLITLEEDGKYGKDSDADELEKIYLKAVSDSMMNDLI